MIHSEELYHTSLYCRGLLNVLLVAAHAREVNPQGVTGAQSSGLGADRPHEVPEHVTPEAVPP